MVPVKNTFSKGLNIDNHIGVSDNESYRYALNLMFNDNNQDVFLSNEHSNRLVAEYSSPIVGKKYINRINSIVVLLANGEIHLYSCDSETSTFVASDTEFGCNWGFQECEWVDIFDTDQYVCDTWLYWSSGKIYYNVNLSELLNPTRKQGLIESLNSSCGEGCTKLTCEYFKVFKTTCDPHFEPIVLDGGSLPNGTYFFGGRYKNDKGGYSNPFPLTQAIHIGCNDNIAGEVCNKRIELTIQNFTCNFNQLELFVERHIGGNVSYIALNSKYIDSKNFSIQYTGLEGEPISGDELYVNSRTYIEGEDLYMYKNRALYYRVTPEFDFNFQPIANQIQTFVYGIKVPLSDVKRYNLKSLLRGETYAVAISPNWTTGKKGYGFHIPGIPASGGCNVASSVNSVKIQFPLKVSDIVNIKTPYKGLGSPSELKVQPLTGTGSSDNNNPIDISGSSSGSGSGSGSTATNILYKRIRTHLDNTPEQLSQDDYVDLVEPIVSSWVTEIDDICKNIEAGCGDIFGNALVDGEINCECGDAIDAMCEQERRDQQAALCRQDNLKVEEIGATWFSAITDYLDEETINGESKRPQSDGSIISKVLNKPVTTLTKLKEASTSIIDKVKKRERYKIEIPDKTFSYNDTYSTDSLVDNNNHEQKKLVTSSGISSSIHVNKVFGLKQPGDNSEPETQVDDDTIDVEVQTGIYKKYPLVFRQRSIPKMETSKYPCNTDCNGVPIYCSLAGTNVYHHKVHGNDIIPFAELHGGGAIGSYYTIEGDPSYDGYAILLSFEFRNINIPSELRSKLCNTNPYNIGIVKRTTATTSVILKGAASNTFVSTQRDKQHLYEKIGTNSFERASKYIDIGSKSLRIDPSAPTDPNNLIMHSLDGLVKRPYLNGTHVIREGTFTGIGERHFLHAKGNEPTDRRDTRKDQRGAVHTISLNSFSPSNVKSELSGQTYYEANKIIAPPTGTNIPLMAKYNQSGLWLVTNGAARSIDDDSFVGDVLNEKAPINNAELDYYSVIREMDDQYGDLSSLNYVPVLQARGFQSTIYGLVGDTYIGPYTFIKTHYVSDRVGDNFPISQYRYGDLQSKADRSVCDCPEDAIFSLSGQGFWTTLPKDGDGADAKRWAGLHTPPGESTKNHDQSVAANITESTYYWPHVTKHAITYIGEFDVNPWLREKSDLLEEQWYPEIKPQYTLHSAEVSNNGDPELGYLNLFRANNDQPPSVKLQLRTMIETFINFLLPLLSVGDVTSANSAPEFTGDVLDFVLQIGVWLLISQVLFTTKFVDEFLQLPICKTDSEGGHDIKIEKWFIEYDKYNMDYSIDYSTPTIIGLPMNYTGCICTDKTINTIYISDENHITTYVNGYQVVRPNSYINLDESFGKLTKIYSIQNNLFLHTTDGIYATDIRQVQIPSSIGEILMGSPVLVEPTLITNTSDTGSMGLEHPNHGKLTTLGFIFVDYNSKDLYINTGNGFENLSGKDKNLRTFFKKFIRFCSYNGCMNEQADGTPYYTFGVDHAHNRLLFTKADGYYSYTLSYDYILKRFVSFHSYIPQEYAYDRNDLYSIKNNQIWKHDVYDKYTTFYDEFNSAILDYTSYFQDYFNYDHTVINTEVNQDGLRDLPITFDQVHISNSHQHTGTINLDIKLRDDYESSDMIIKAIDKTDTIDLNKIAPNQFRFNEIANYRNSEEPIITYDECIPEPILDQNVDYSDRSNQTYFNRILFDNHLHYRYIFSKFANAKLYIKSILTFLDKPQV